MKKMTGHEYKQFLNADWDALLGLTESYMADEEVTVNGEDEPSDSDWIPDDAKVVIHSGCIVAKEDVDMSLETAYTRWKKTQTHTTLVISVPNQSVEYMRQQVSIVNGKVIK